MKFILILVYFLINIAFIKSTSSKSGSMQLYDSKNPESIVAVVNGHLMFVKGTGTKANDLETMFEYDGETFKLGENRICPSIGQFTLLRTCSDEDSNRQYWSIYPLPNKPNLYKLKSPDQSKCAIYDVLNPNESVIKVASCSDENVIVFRSVPLGEFYDEKGRLSPKNIHEYNKKILEK